MDIRQELTVCQGSDLQRSSAEAKGTGSCQAARENLWTEPTSDIAKGGKTMPAFGWAVANA